MADECQLKAAVGGFEHCEQERCVFWQAVDHLDPSAPMSGCAIQHYRLLGPEGDGIASWLLDVKARLERVERERPSS